MASTNSRRSVLITGCSDGGMGAALAIAFHKAGLHVLATARNPSKMKGLVSLGIETLQLDVQSPTSITDCIGKLSSLDILMNNAGTQFVMPTADVSISEAKEVFDLNVWAHIAMIQACLPLILKSSRGMIINHTSIGAVTTLPLMGTYGASKAALSHFSDSLRLELQPFDIKVVELRTAVVQTNLIKNAQATNRPSLPKGSIYEPAKELVEKSMLQEHFKGVGMTAEKWAELTVKDLLKKTPPPVIWRGESAFLAWIGTLLPFGSLDTTAKKVTGFDVVETILRKSR